MRRCASSAAAARRTCASARRFTGWTVDGGYADAVDRARGVRGRVCPTALDDLDAAPLLCAGVIGYRALRRAEVAAGRARRAARASARRRTSRSRCCATGAARWSCSTRGERHRELARELGAAWVGDAAELPPEPCDRAVVFAPAGELVPVALEVVRPGGTVSLAGIHMTPIPSFDYALLWRERTLRSVANMTRQDAEEFMALAAEADLRATFETFPLEDANDGAARDRAGRGARRRGARGRLTPARSRRGGEAGSVQRADRSSTGTAAGGRALPCAQ